METTMEMMGFERDAVLETKNDPGVLHTWWVASCDQVRVAYQRWCDADATTRDDCYAVLIAMMDQEATAATVYGRTMTVLAARDATSPAVLDTIALGAGHAS